MQNVAPSSNLTPPDVLANYKLEPSVVVGETTCGFITSTYVPAKAREEPLNEVMYEFRLKSVIKSVVFRMHNLSVLTNASPM